MHEHSVIHRDLKPDNVLLDEHFYPRIADFGMSNIVGSESKEKTMNGGTPVFIAPEIYTNSGFDFKVDVYAFGMMLYQIMTLKEPFAEFRKNLFMIWHKILSGARPPFPSGFPQPFKDVITQCWDRNPAVRPPFAEIVGKIESNELMLDDVDQARFDAYRSYLDS